MRPNIPASVVVRMRGGLVVSCQPVPDGPLDTVEAVVAFALAAEAAGAVGLRIEGVANVAAVAEVSRLPIIGLIKRDLDDSPVRITPFIDDVRALVEAGATIVAVDATDRRRPITAAKLIREIKRLGVLAMADISTEQEARAALAAQADIVGTTMAGYTGAGQAPALPDLELVRQCAGLGAVVFAEGRYNSPALAADAIRAGADVVVVGSAITRVEHITTWFREAIAAAAPSGKPVLAFDIGGTKTLAALVRGREILERATIPTPRDITRTDWPDTIAGIVPREWRGRFDRAVAAATGLVIDGKWSSLNPDTLCIPPAFPLSDKLEAALGVPVATVNDAQAAAWGEYRFGAGRGRDIVFLTVSSGIGGGVVVDGRLWQGARGIAGSLGQTPLASAASMTRLESSASGFGIAAAATAGGWTGDARAVFDAARAGEAWAENIVQAAAAKLAGALVGLQALVDPQCVVIGGSVGLADGFIERLRQALQGYGAVFVPDLVKAQLGADAGIVGAADLLGRQP